jgi:drug/metabolite transporter (DMT)-like permease
MKASDGHDLPMLGILLKVMAVALFSCMAACVKYLEQEEVPAGQMIFVRSLIALATLVLITGSTGRLHLLRTDNWQSHARRSVSAALSMFLWFVALGLAPLAEVTAATYLAPIFLTPLATLVLGERFHVYRWAAVALGCAGAAIMIGPYLSLDTGHSLGIALAMGSALLTALGMIFLRGMSRAEHPITITFYHSLTILVAAAVSVLWGWHMPSARQWTIIVLVGVLGTGGQLLHSAAYRYAEASIIAPLDYSGMIIIVLLGYFLFDEIPGMHVWMGAPLVIAAGLVILWREYQLRNVRSDIAAAQERSTL